MTYLDELATRGAEATSEATRDEVKARGPGWIAFGDFNLSLQNAFELWDGVSKSLRRIWLGFHGTEHHRSILQSSKQKRTARISKTLRCGRKSTSGFRKGGREIEAAIKEITFSRQASTEGQGDG